MQELVVVPDFFNYILKTTSVLEFMYEDTGGKMWTTCYKRQLDKFQV